ncbi:MAG: hypothetical protein BGO01_05445 [Armatimonadetes bacterium 55-13]|nr:hypothetical protein [Armatimonadota bacterium]OJU61522.1 MAG: hypothetical protein BGO01_05445 [Armatimonadetes bacterium 55-13]
MKREIPKPLVYSVVVVVVGLVCFFGFRMLSGPPEFPAAKLKLGPDGAVPSYMKGKLSPEMEKMVEEQTKKYGATEGGTGNPGNQPTAPPAPGQ